MRRRLFNLAAAVSLVLCVATVAVWHRSYRIADVFGFETAVTGGGRNRGGNVGSEWGVVWVGLFRRQMPTSPPSAGVSFSLHRPVDPRQVYLQRRHLASQGAVQFLGFDFVCYDMDPRGGPFPKTDPPTTQRAWLVRVPCWFIVLTMSVLPCLWQMRYRRHRRRVRANRCPA